MKKAAAWFAFLVFSFSPAWSQTREKIKFLPDEEKYIMVGILGGFFFAHDQVFREIYGNSVPYFGPEMTFRFPIRDPHGLDVALGGRFLRASGKTSYTEEESSLRLTSLSISMRYSFETGRFALFLGPGMDYVWYKETYAETFPLASVEGDEAGFHLTGGGYYHLSPALSLKGYFKYCMVETESYGFRVNLGGSEWGFGLIYRFYL
jgi:opacity protein-like surface antigen